MLLFNQHFKNQTLCSLLPLNHQCFQMELPCHPNEFRQLRFCCMVFVLRNNYYSDNRKLWKFSFSAVFCFIFLVLLKKKIIFFSICFCNCCFHPCQSVSFQMIWFRILQYMIRVFFNPFFIPLDYLFNLKFFLFKFVFFYFFVLLIVGK